MTTDSYRVTLADWNRDADDIIDIRSRVFIDEQNVPADLEWDGLDPECTHFLVFDDDRPIATARLKPDGHIGRMAVLKDYRHRGAGSALLAKVIDNAKHAGLAVVFLHAQAQATGFYKKHGFIEEGEEFLDAGITHRAMRRKIC